MEAIVRHNAVFQRIVKPHSFRTWQGNPEDAREFTFELAPAIRWTPMHSGEEFKTPDTMAGDLLINCEILVKGTNVSDLTNFWWMVVRCFYPSTWPTATRTSRRCMPPVPAAAWCCLLSRRSTPDPMACSWPDRDRSRSRFNRS